MRIRPLDKLVDSWSIAVFVESALQDDIAATSFVCNNQGRIFYTANPKKNKEEMIVKSPILPIL